MYRYRNHVYRHYESGTLSISYLHRNHPNRHKRIMWHLKRSVIHQCTINKPLFSRYRIKRHHKHLFIHLVMWWYKRWYDRTVFSNPHHTTNRRWHHILLL